LAAQKGKTKKDQNDTEDREREEISSEILKPQPLGEGPDTDRQEISHRKYPPHESAHSSQWGLSAQSGIGEVRERYCRRPMIFV
jgi:hypothetical protein